MRQKWRSEIVVYLNIKNEKATPDYFVKQPKSGILGKLPGAPHTILGPSKIGKRKENRRQSPNRLNKSSSIFHKAPTISY